MTPPPLCKCPHKYAIDSDENKFRAAVEPNKAKMVGYRRTGRYKFDLLDDG